MSMVKQTRRFFDPTDVLQVRLVCCLELDGKPCEGEVLMQFGQRAHDPTFVCPRCGESWKTDHPSSMQAVDRLANTPETERMSLALLESVEFLSSARGKRFTIRFEIDGESEENA